MICRYGLGHYQLIASMRDLKFGLSVCHHTIHHSAVIGTTSVMVFMSVLHLFLQEAVRDILGKLHVVQCCAA